MRQSFKKTAENNSQEFENHLGDLLNKTWEITRVSSLVIDKCLQVQSVADNPKYLCLLLMSRNLLSDCCCCLDALERGHERTIFNNLRMILEDLCCIIDASENEKVWIALQNGKHQASQSVSFAIKKYSTQDIGYLYGKLSKISHHMLPELFIRQCINRDRSITHLKLFHPNQYQAQLDILLMVTHFARLVGEVAEKPYLQELEVPYFWTKQKTRNLYSPISITISELTEKIEKEMQRLDGPREQPSDYNNPPIASSGAKVVQ